MNEEVVLGEVGAFGSFPAEVKIGHHSYYLAKDGEGFGLVSRVCPHAGYEVEIEDGEFYCPLHGWTFDLESGRCLNVPSTGLRRFEVIVREGQFIAMMTP
ncbi:Rieske (2Fe-2S) protein [Paenibacillus sp. GCM10023252]|uniref:Rieske (2Fe-2S) protein n=1 Tax=Paenibacillus sp. GCM10023252 TaxID=3252649 RepID=UPI00360A7433